MPDGSYTCASCGDSLDDIVAIIDHGCEQMLAAEDLDRRERSTIVHVEDRIVNNRSILDPEKLNHDDFANFKLFGAAGLLDVKDVEAGIAVVKFTAEAWDLARDCRKIIAEDRLHHDADLGGVPAAGGVQ